MDNFSCGYHGGLVIDVYSESAVLAFSTVMLMAGTEKRKETLLWETRRGRRALQILHISVDIPLQEELGQIPLTLLMEGPSILKNQTGRGREDYCLHTFFPTPPVGQKSDDSLASQQ